MKKLSADELKWRAQSDADTIARYDEIMGDKPRLNRAVKIAQERARELTKQANRMNNVGKTRGTTKGRK